MPRALIADYEKSVRTLVARALVMDDHRPVTAAASAEALEILTTERGAFDLWLADIEMPAMDAIALALSTVREFPHLTNLFMAGFADLYGRSSNVSAIAHVVVTNLHSDYCRRAALADALAARRRD